MDPVHCTSEGCSQLLNTSGYVLDKLVGPVVGWHSSHPTPQGTVATYWLCSKNGELSCHRNPLDYVSEEVLHHSDYVLRLCLLKVDQCILEDANVQPVGTKLLMDDRILRVWSFELGPGEQSEFHEHQVPYIFVNLPSGIGANLTQEVNSKGDLVGSSCRQQDWESCSVDSAHLGAHALRNIGESKFVQCIVEFVA